MNRDDLKKNLEYICKSKKGYACDLITHIGSDCANQFESVGFITKGHTLKHSTWKKTQLADRYYKELYGNFAYLINVLLFVG